MNYYNPLQESQMLGQAGQTGYASPSTGGYTNGYVGGAGNATAPTEAPIFQSMSVLSNHLDTLEHSVSELVVRLQSISLPSAPEAANQAKEVSRSRSQMGDAIMSCAERIGRVNQMLTVLKGNLAL